MSFKSKSGSTIRLEAGRESISTALVNPNALFLSGPFTTHDAASTACSAKGMVLCSIDLLADARSAAGYEHTSVGWFSDPSRDIRATSCGSDYCTPDNCVSGFPVTSIPSTRGAYCCTNVAPTAVSSCPSDCPKAWIGDGYCDSECNVDACRYDDGDCCQSQCKDTCSKEYKCGYNGYACAHPGGATTGTGAGTGTASPIVTTSSAQEFSVIQGIHHTSRFRPFTHSGRTYVVLRRGLYVPVRVSLESVANPASLSFRLQLVGGGASYTGVIQPTPPITEGGNTCKVPFTYAGTTYYSCTPAGTYNPWCYIENPSSYSWGYCAAAASSNVRTVLFSVPIDAPVGEYRLQLTGAALNSPLSFVIVFNPYHSRDAVYLSDATQIGEYIERDSGAVFQTSSSRYVVWAYDQFTSVSVRTLLAFLSSVSATSRKQPHLVSRELSYWTGAKLLTGRWHEPYNTPENSKEPWTWGASAEIYEKYLTDGQQSVRYGQCWVFAALVTSLGRAVGIPSRPDTAIHSAHEAPPYDGYTDKYWARNADGEWFVDRSKSADSVWNFHVWASLYMRRPDVSGGDGWQIVDATPQERSTDSRFVMGPASHSRIRAIVQKIHSSGGDISSARCFDLSGVVKCNRKLTELASITQSFDEPFGISEVSATERSWVVSTDGTSLYDMMHSTVGRPILTQSPGEFRGSASDVTSSYKPSFSFARFRSQSQSQANREFSFKVIQPESHSVTLGAPFQVGVSIQSTASVGRSLTVLIDSVAISEIGSPSADLTNSTVKHHKHIVWVNPGATVSVTDTIQFHDYAANLRSDHDIRTSVVVSLANHPMPLSIAEFQTGLVLPPLVLTLSLPDDSTLLAIATFRNPLKMALADCRIYGTLSGAEISESNFIGDIPVDLKFPMAFDISSVEYGEHTVSMALSCANMANVHGSKQVDLQQ